MRLASGSLPLVTLFLFAGCVFGEEVEITVFTLKDGKQVETISHASGMKDGQRLYSVTTTTGEKKKILGLDVVSQENVKKDLSELPDYARKTVELKRKAREEWAARAAAEQEAEEEKRKHAFIQAAELAKEGKVVREAELQERIIRQRCATLQDAQERAKRQARAAQEDIRRERSNYDRRRRDDRNRNNRNNRNNRDSRYDRYSDNRIRDAERRLQNANNQVKQHGEKLAQAKKELAQAEQKVAEAERKYKEALKRFKMPVKTTSETASAETPSTQQAPEKAPPKPAAPVKPVEPDAQSTVTENIDRGKFIKLADNSFWQVRPEHRTSSSTWKPEQQVSIFGCADPFYPYRLVNGTTKMAVNAKKME